MKNKKTTSFSPNKKTNINQKHETNQSNIIDNNIYDISITVHIKNQSYKIFCGDGKQRIKWLIDVAIHYYDRNFGLESGNSLKN